MNITQNNLCIIPARGGSKRIPGKNIKEFLGKPIIAYSIETAVKSGLFETVMVSTDDTKVGEIAREFGAEVPFLRSTRNANDFAPLKDAIDEVIQYYKNEGRCFDKVCCILPTAPLLQIKDLKSSLRLMDEKMFDSIRPIVKYNYPIQRALKLIEGEVKMNQPEYFLSRSQDLEEMYHDAGMFYWMKFDKGLDGGNKGGFVINSLFTQDIDEIEDWEIAEFKFNFLFPNNEKE